HLVVLDNRVRRLEGPDPGVVSRVLVPGMAGEVVFHQCAICIANRNRVPTEVTQLVIAHHHSSGGVPIQWSLRIVHQGLVRPRRAHELDPRTVDALDGVAFDEHVVEFGGHPVELPVVNIGFDVEEDPSVPLRVQVPVDAVHVQIPNGDPVDDAEVTRGDVDGAQVLVPVRVFIQPETGTEPGVQVGDLQAGN